MKKGQKESVLRDEERVGYNDGSDTESELDSAVDDSAAQGESAPELDLAGLLMQFKNEVDKEKAVGAEYLRRLQNLQADYDNFRKRTQKEKEELAKYASEKIITDILPVVDNLERGLAASCKSGDFESLSKGMEMILKQLVAVLEKEGLKPVDSQGTEFDPTKHEAIMHVDVDGMEPNTVVDEIQKGYYLKDKVLRPSMVRVCR